MKPTSNHLLAAIHSRKMASADVREFGIHPEDYFFLEAEWLRARDSHPFHVANAMQVTLFVKDDAPRLGA